MISLGEPHADQPLDACIRRRSIAERAFEPELKLKQRPLGVNEVEKI